MRRLYLGGAMRRLCLGGALRRLYACGVQCNNAMHVIWHDDKFT